MGGTYETKLCQTYWYRGSLVVASRAPAVTVVMTVCRASVAGTVVLTRRGPVVVAATVTGRRATTRIAAAVRCISTAIAAVSASVIRTTVSNVSVAATSAFRAVRLYVASLLAQEAATFAAFVLSGVTSAAATSGGRSASVPISGVVSPSVAVPSSVVSAVVSPVVGSATALIGPVPHAAALPALIFVEGPGPWSPLTVAALLRQLNSQGGPHKRNVVHTADGARGGFGVKVGDKRVLAFANNVSLDVAELFKGNSKVLRGHGARDPANVDLGHGLPIVALLRRSTSLATFRAAGRV